MISCTLVLVVFLLASALLEGAGAARHAARRQRQLLTRTNLADAVVQDARDRLARGTLVPDDDNPNWSTSFAIADPGNASCGVRLLKDANGNPIPGRYELNASGSLGGDSSTVRAVVRKSSPLGPFNYALCGYQQTEVRFAKIDAYNSTTALAIPLLPGAGDRNAVVATNGTTAGSVSIGDTGAVYGSLVVGPGTSPPASGVTNTSTLTPAVPTTAGAAAIGFSALTIPAGVGPGGSLNRDTTLAAGTYVYDSINLRGTELVTCNGPVVIYCRAGLSITGNGFSTYSALPPNLIIYYTGNAEVLLSPRLPFMGAVWAPSATVRLGKKNQLTMIYGAIVANQVLCRGDQNDDVQLNFFQDRALRHPGADWADHTVFRLIAWDAR